MFLRANITESDFFSVTTSILNPHSGAHAQVFELCACRSANVHKRAQGGPLLRCKARGRSCACKARGLGASTRTTTRQQRTVQRGRAARAAPALPPLHAPRPPRAMLPLVRCRWCGLQAHA